MRYIKGMISSMSARGRPTREGQMPSVVGDSDFTSRHQQLGQAVKRRDQSAMDDQPGRHTVRSALPEIARDLDFTAQSMGTFTAGVRGCIPRAFDGNSRYSR
jgi:hypothetical protein